MVVVQVCNFSENIPFHAEYCRMFDIYELASATWKIVKLIKGNVFQ